jgi:hypothetical protein
MASTSVLSEHGMGLGHLPELAGEVGLLGGCERLITEEDHMVRVQGVTHGGHLLGCQRRRDVDVPDLGSDFGREWMHAEAGGDLHRRIVPHRAAILNTGPAGGPTLSFAAMAHEEEGAET